MPVEYSDSNVQQAVGICCFQEQSVLENKDLGVFKNHRNRVSGEEREGLRQESQGQVMMFEGQPKEVKETC